MLYLTESRESGDYPRGKILFKSETYNVDARFTSDWSTRFHGFTLDVRSTDCADGMY